MIKDDLTELIVEKRSCVGVIGLGYVGLPLIVEFCLKGYRGIGFEVDRKKADQIVITSRFRFTHDEGLETTQLNSAQR